MTFVSHQKKIIISVIIIISSSSSIIIIICTTVLLQLGIEREDARYLHLLRTRFYGIMSISEGAFEGKKGRIIWEEHIDNLTPSYSYDFSSCDGLSSISFRSVGQRRTARRSILLSLCKVFIIVSLTFFSLVPSAAMGTASQSSSSSTTTTSGKSATGSVSSRKATQLDFNSTAESSVSKEAQAAHSLALLLLLLGEDVVDKDDGDEARVEEPIQGSTPTSTPTSTSLVKSQSEQYHPFLVICTVDGDIMVLNAHDGALVCAFNSGSPLVGPSEPLSDDNQEEDYVNGQNFNDPPNERRIVPGLDGQLYVTSTDGILKPLEITVLDVLANPVKTCRSSGRSNNKSHEANGGCDDSNNNCLDYVDDTTDCGIVTATKSMSLFALDPTTGNLVWHQHQNGTTQKMNHDEGGASSTVLLQREDVLVQQISTNTGASVWNVTLGTLQALAFGDADGPRSTAGQQSGDRLPHAMEQGFLPTEDETLDDREKIHFDDDSSSTTKLPKVLFSEDGTSLTAIDPSYNSNHNNDGTKPSHLMWSREFPTIVASVFGLNGKSWEPLTVLDDYEDELVSERTDRDIPLLPQPDDFNTNDPSLSNPLFKDSSALVLFNQPNDQESKQLFRTDRLNHGRDWLFRNAIRQHRKSQQMPLFPYNSPSRATLLVPDGKGAGSANNNHFHNFVPNYLQIAPPVENNVRPGPLFCLSSDPRTCVSIDTHGLFLRWPALLLATVCVATIAIVFYRRFYEQRQKKRLGVKKRQGRWPKLKASSLHNRSSRSKVSFQDDDDINPMAYSADNIDLFMQHQDESFAANHLLGESHGTSDRELVNKSDKNKVESNNDKSFMTNGFVRSHSEPGNMDQHHRASKVQEGRIEFDKDRTTTSTKSGSTNQSTKPDGVDTLQTPPKLSLEATLSQSTSNSNQYGVGLIDGTIPLIQYTRYASEFEEIGALGKGGFGSVFQCRNALDKREYAIKKVLIRKDSKLPQSDFTKRLKRTLREVKSLALLDHSNIVRYYTAWLELARMDDRYSSDIHSEGAHSDYYMMSATKTSKVQRSGLGLDLSQSSRSPYWKSKSSFNPFGSGRVLPSVSDNSFSSSSCYNHDSTTNHDIPFIPEALDDYGFVFDRSSKEGEQSCKAGEKSYTPAVEENMKIHTSTEQQLSSKSDANPSGSKPRMNNAISFQSFISSKSSNDESTSGWSKETRNESDVTGKENKLVDEKEDAIATESSISQRYILYIQMQFCSQKTLLDFLSNEKAREGPSGSSIGNVDIPYALSLFLETCQGVEHVHSQGLIHRDLKPNNIFIDDTGAVKVGDFGLSRESSESGEGVIEEESAVLTGSTNLGYNADITAGVGTRSYASPEQMKGGSDYDSSTDIYSLGIILFELCYPMYTVSIAQCQGCAIS